MESKSPLENELGNDPWNAFSSFYKQALALDVPNPNWMVLSTASDVGADARVVLLKEYNVDQGFVFYTNYNSPKSKHLTENSNCCLLFYWDILYLQIRIKGQANKISAEESDKYFASRDKLSQVGAHASLQSQILKNRSELDTRVKEINHKYMDSLVPRPANWGGWVVKPYYFEFWKGQTARLHERLVFSWQENKWKQYLIYP